MESNKKSSGIRQMANISNPDFLDYVNANHANFNEATSTTDLGGGISVRIHRELQYRLKKASKITGVSQRVIVTHAISLYLQYIEKELAENLSEGYEK